MASKEYLYALVRFNSLLRARGWGANIEDSHFASIRDTGNDDTTLALWSSIPFLFGNGMILRLFYVAATEEKGKQKKIGVAALTTFTAELGYDTIPVLILHGKPSPGAAFEIQKNFPIVYSFNNFVMNDSIYNSPSYRESDEVLKYLSKSANMKRLDLVVPIRHTDLSLYTPTDVVPFVQYMKAEETIFCTERQTTIPNTYVMVNYRYVGKHFSVPREELEEKEKSKARTKEEASEKNKAKRKGKKSKEDAETERRKAELLLYAEQTGFGFGSSYRENSYGENGYEETYASQPLTGSGYEGSSSSSGW